MKSPFPGMDPYIEACGLWGDFHDDLINEIKRALSREVPERYLVRTGERSYLVLVESEGKESRPFIPDVRITTKRGRRKQVRAKGSLALAEPGAADEPITMRAFIEEEQRESFIEIYEARPEQRLVTTIEVLSPANKQPGSPGRELYLRKRHAVLLADVNLVEIDLLRGGQRMPMLDPWPPSSYVMLVARAKKPQSCQVWPGDAIRPLSPIPVPLAKPDPDVPLNLQPMIDAIYERSRYAQSIDYRQPLNPPLDPHQAAWLKRQLRVQSK